ncbi:cysteine desulfurase family protein [Solimonas marina]|uniref:Cysteine desulfurase n=1 Tax=Solimonas marina TaxID=2714601 RepID=A0A970BBQ7_9GAMM|nr:cysteine desulfurase family protein [Solimonas marina]NKF24711.1 cysteine desulfurase [Solimonas marina]
MPVYFDNNATTRLDPRVLEAMLPYLSGPYGNASSLHRFGRAARDAVERAREQLAMLAGCQSREIIWTSGGTESDNLALKGVTEGALPTRVLYGATEHPAVLETAEALRARGWGVETVAIGRDGLIDGPRFERQLAAGPVRLVSLMRVNNETGVIQDVARAVDPVHAAGGWLHVDAVQALGKIPLDFTALRADLMSVSSHKIYGPKGIGALIVRADVELAPLHHGGVQERGLRGGTENVASIVGFGAAAELALQELDARAAHTQSLREQLESGLRSLPGVQIFADGAPKAPNTVQFAVAGYHGEALLMQLDRKGFAVSSGSACSSGKGEPSHVLLGMGIAYEVADGAVRVSFGKDNSAAEVEQFLAALAAITQAAMPAMQP